MINKSPGKVKQECGSRALNNIPLAVMPNITCTGPRNQPDP